MSFGDLYTLPPGQDVAPGLPPVDLPRVQGEPPRRPPLRITVSKPAPKPWEKDYSKHPDGTWGAKAPDFKSPTPNPFDQFDEHPDGKWGARAPDMPKPWEKDYNVFDQFDTPRDVSAGEAFARSAAHGATFGLEPFLEGVGEALTPASGMPAPTDITGRASGAAARRAAIGTVNEVAQLLGMRHDQEIVDAYHRGRAHAQAELEAGREQHPGYSLAGEMTGAIAGPGVGGFAAVPANIGGRIVRGAAAGGVGGGLYGAGSAVSEGKGLGDIGESAATGASGGAVLGGTFGGLLGPRIPQALTRGEQAAQTAEDLGVPLARGLASDNRLMQGSTRMLRNLPLTGDRIGRNLEAVQEAAGGRIGEIAAGGAGAAPDRALAGSMLRPALQGVIEDNNARIDQAYGVLDRVIQSHLFGALPRTRAAVQGIVRQRRGARMDNPEAGLADVINLVRTGVSFDGLQRQRNQIGRMIQLAENNPNPGFNVADFRRLYAAMTGDMEGIVRQHARPGVHPDRAAEVLREAHRVAATFAGHNSTVQRVLNVQADERLVGSLLTAAQERTGNLRLLAQLRASMHPDDFHNIGGVMLAELGRNRATGAMLAAEALVSAARSAPGRRRVYGSLPGGWGIRRRRQRWPRGAGRAVG
jgi:hypothetical protein